MEFLPGWSFGFCDFLVFCLRMTHTPQIGKATLNHVDVVNWEFAVCGFDPTVGVRVFFSAQDMWWFRLPQVCETVKLLSSSWIFWLLNSLIQTKPKIFGGRFFGGEENFWSPDPKTTTVFNPRGIFQRGGLRLRAVRKRQPWSIGHTPWPNFSYAHFGKEAGWISLGPVSTLPWWLDEYPLYTGRHMGVDRPEVT